ncbi:hypothetical protein ABK040_007363 [Willaertia magna]
MEWKRKTIYLPNQNITLTYISNEHLLKDDNKLNPLLLIHGWLDSAESFIVMFTTLHQANIPFYAIDLRGYGDSDKPFPNTELLTQQQEVTDDETNLLLALSPIDKALTSLYSLPTFCKDLNEFVELKLAGKKVNVLGHSMGTIITQCMIRFHHDKLNKVILMGGASTLVNHKILEDMYESDDLLKSSINNLDTIEIMKKAKSEEAIKEFQNTSFFDLINHPPKKEIYEMVIRETSKAPCFMWKVGIEMMLQLKGHYLYNEFTKEDFQKINSSNVFVFFGKGDVLFTKEDQFKLLEQIGFSSEEEKNEHFIEFEGAGHSIQWDKGELVSSELIRILYN